MRPTIVALAISIVSASAYASDDVALPELQEPSKQAAAGEAEIPIESREIDLANIVTSAAKGVTTVQEAPAIITIITAEDIKSRGHKWLLEALSTVPGWLYINSEGSQVPNPLVRGVSQAILLLRDGVSL